MFSRATLPDQAGGLEVNTESLTEGNAATFDALAHLSAVHTLEAGAWRTGLLDELVSAYLTPGGFWRSRILAATDRNRPWHNVPVEALRDLSTVLKEDASYGFDEDLAKLELAQRYIHSLHIEKPTESAELLQEFDTMVDLAMRGASTDVLDTLWDSLVATNPIE